MKGKKFSSSHPCDSKCGVMSVPTQHLEHQYGGVRSRLLRSVWISSLSEHCVALLRYLMYSHFKWAVTSSLRSSRNHEKLIIVPMHFIYFLLLLFPFLPFFSIFPPLPSVPSFPFLCFSIFFSFLPALFHLSFFLFFYSSNVLLLSKSFKSFKWNAGFEGSRQPAPDVNSSVASSDFPL